MISNKLEMPKVLRDEVSGREKWVMVNKKVASQTQRDGTIRPGGMRNALYPAFYGSRELQSATVAKWGMASLKDPASRNNVAAEWIEELNNERARISSELKLVK